MHMKAFVLLGGVLAVAALGCSRDAPAPVAATEAPAATPAPGEIRPIPAAEYEEPVVGGARMLVGDDILTSLSKSNEHRIMLDAVRRAGLQDIFGGSGPITVFAPTDAAFKAMPGGFDRLLQPENQEKLLALLSYHVLPERLDDHAFAQKVMAGNDQAQLATLEGSTIKATVSDGSAILLDQSGAAAKLSVPNVLQRNGVIQVVDKVLLPAGW